MVTDINTVYEMEVNEMPRLVRLTCQRCKHKWVPRIPNPAVCPNCHSPYWRKPATTKRRKTKK
jgi:hypothetical protein